MTIRKLKTAVVGVLALTALANCSQVKEPAFRENVASDTFAGTGFNGGGWNGGGWNGGGFNGGGFNGGGFNGGGFNGGGFNGGGFNGGGWNGGGFNGGAYNGLSTDGINGVSNSIELVGLFSDMCAAGQDKTVQQDAPVRQEAGSGGELRSPSGTDDKLASDYKLLADLTGASDGPSPEANGCPAEVDPVFLNYLKYLVQCALPADQHISYCGHTFQGNLGVVPGYCSEGGVSATDFACLNACMLAFVNPAVTEANMGKLKCELDIGGCGVEQTPKEGMVAEGLYCSTPGGSPVACQSPRFSAESIEELENQGWKKMETYIKLSTRGATNLDKIAGEKLTQVSCNDICDVDPVCLSEKLNEAILSGKKGLLSTPIECYVNCDIPVISLDHIKANALNGLSVHSPDGEVPVLPLTCISVYSYPGCGGTFSSNTGVMGPGLAEGGGILQ